MIRKPMFIKFISQLPKQDTILKCTGPAMKHTANFMVALNTTGRKLKLEVQVQKMQWCPALREPELQLAVGEVIHNRK